MLVSPRHLLTLLVACLAAPACGSDKNPSKRMDVREEAPEVTDQAAQAAKTPPRPRARAAEALRRPASSRVVVVGGLDGNLAATRASLVAAGVVDAAGTWSGGDSVLVQLGNQLGPGKDERAVLKLLDDLASQASGAGGAVYRLSGEQEILNVALTFTNVTPQGFKEFAKERPADDDPRIAGLPAAQRGRAAVMAAGGQIAAKLAEQPLVLIVGDSVFAHAGVLGDHVRHGLDTLNTEAKQWMLGEQAMMPDMLAIPGPARTPRLRGQEPDCDEVEQVLSDLAVKRMVITRGPDKSESSMCDGRLIRLGPVQGDASGSATWLEIRGDEVKQAAVAP